MAIYSGFSPWKWWFSIVMLVYQRVNLRKPWLTLPCTLNPTIVNSAGIPRASSVGDGPKTGMCGLRPPRGGLADFGRWADGVHGFLFHSVVMFHSFSINILLHSCLNPMKNGIQLNCLMFFVDVYHRKDVSWIPWNKWWWIPSCGYVAMSCLPPINWWWTESHP